MAHEPLVSFFFSSRRRHTRFDCDWSSDVCSSDLVARTRALLRRVQRLQPAPTASAAPADALFSIDPQGQRVRSEERRVGKSVDLGGRRIIKKKKRINEGTPAR